MDGWMDVWQRTERRRITEQTDPSQRPNVPTATAVTAFKAGHYHSLSHCLYLQTVT